MKVLNNSSDASSGEKMERPAKNACLHWKKKWKIKVYNEKRQEFMLKMKSRTKDINDIIPVASIIITI